MNLHQYNKHHSALDQRIIGFSAVYEATNNVVTFDSTIVVLASEDTLRQWLVDHGITAPVIIEHNKYSHIIAGMHEEGIGFLLDHPALERFHAIVAQDLRFVPKIEKWESEVGVMIEPVFNMYRDSVNLFKDQLRDATVGFYASEDTQQITLIGTKESFELRYPDINPVELTWDEYTVLDKLGIRFKPDVISRRRITQLNDLERFCEYALRFE